MPSQFGTVYQKIVTTTTDYTFSSVNNPDLLLVDTTAGNITVTLPTPVSVYSNGSQGLGPLRIINIGATGYSVLLVAAAGTLYGNSKLVGYGQGATLTADGVGGWYQFDVIGSSYEVQVSLSAAQIIAMNGTPVTIIPAPGAGKVVIVESMLLKMVRTSTAFTGGGAVEFRYTGTSGAKVTADLSATMITGGAGTAYASAAGVTTELTPVANALICVTNATAVFAAGTGVGVVTCKFRIVTP